MSAHVSDREPSGNPAILVTVNDAAQRLAISPRSVWKLIAAGSLAVVRIGRSTRVRLADLERFAAEGVA